MTTRNLSRRLRIALLAAGLAGILTGAPAPAAAPQAPDADSASVADCARRLETHVRRLADDSLEGRFMGTPGIEEAARYIAGEFQVMGLEAPADSSYLQEFSLPLGRAVMPDPVMGLGERDLRHGGEFEVLPISGSGQSSPIMAGSSLDRKRIRLHGHEQSLQIHAIRLRGISGAVDRSGKRSRRDEEYGNRSRL